MPKRIQRKRTKGWRMPANTVCVTRPSIFGNPFATAEEFRQWLTGPRNIGDGYGLRRVTLMARLHELRGKNLACFCPLDRSCHADVLLEIVNGGAPDGQASEA